MWKLFHKIFGWEYVLLELCTGDILIRKATIVGEHVCATPYCSNTMTRLFPKGQVSGAIFVVCWKPVTPNTIKYYSS